MSQRFLLAVDVGNTATSVGAFALPPTSSNPTPRYVWTLSTPDILKSNAFSFFLRRCLKRARLSPAAVSAAIVSSVVPSVDAPLRRQLRAITGHDVPFVSNQTKMRVKIRYRRPKEVGADRIVNARAAMALWKGPAIVIDFGTATTFDCVTRDGSYLGGVIAPGPVISAEALYRRTAKLPLVLLDKPVSILGRDTLQSIQAGLYHGYRGLVKEIVAQLKRRMGPRTKVMATGGQAHWILRGVSGVDAFVPHLTLLGLFHLWHDRA